MLLTVLYKLEKSVLEVSAWLRLQQKEVLQKLVKKNMTLVQSLNKKNKYLENVIKLNKADIDETVDEINRLKDLLRKY
jgi:DNA-directed RNA polymerase subunit F